MKRLVYSASDASARYQQMQQDKLNNRAKKEAKQNYVDSIRKEVTSELEERIETELFRDSQNNDLFDNYFDEYVDRYQKYHDSDLDQWISDLRDQIGVRCYMSSEDAYMTIGVDVFGEGNSNHGLEWLADLQTGGDGSLHCIYVSKMPSRMKRKMKEYQEIVSQYIEDLGFEVLAPAKYNSSGFVYYVTDETYESLM